MAEFSKINITFIEDVIEGKQCNITSSLDGVSTTQIFFWVATRSAPFEVTTGTPTGNAGERTAINFAAAYLLDNPTNFIVNQTLNEVEIISEIEGLNFYAFKISGTSSGLGYLATYNNFAVPVDYSNIEFALVKSPHYVSIPFYFDTTNSVNIKLFIWDGALASPPATPTVSLTIPRPTVNFSEFNVDLAGLINEKLEPKPVINLSSTTQIINSTNDSVKWIHYTVSYSDPTESIANIEGTFVAVDGYGFYNEGVNPTKPSNNILTDASLRKVSREGFILFPFINNGVITSIQIDSNNNEISEVQTITASDNSSNMVQYLEIDASQTTTDEFIKVTTLPAGDITVYEIIDECRYNPIQVIFKNKYGNFDSLTLFKKSNNSLDVENSVFINNYIKSGFYDTTKHQTQKINITGNETIKVNSGYVNESENKLYKQLLLSETVYFYENGLVPVNVKSSSLEFKTRVNDKLIQYSIEFEYAYNLIQNV